MPNELVPSDVVRAIQDSVDTVLIDVGGTAYVTRPVFAPPIEALAATLEVHRLSGLVDYLAANLDGLSPALHGIHVADYDSVQLVGVLEGRPRRREVLVSAVCESLGFTYGRYYSCEDFNIALQSLFVDDLDRAAVLKVVGNIKEEMVGQFDDDGVSQTVTARAGIARVAEVPVPNPVTLRPYRTFVEVEQPASPFVLRVKSGMKDGDKPSCALFEADGGKWKVEAIQTIARALRVMVAELPESMRDIPIIA